MSIFSTLPAYPPTLNTNHAHAAGLAHSWLFNRGTGTTVKDDVTNQTATLQNGPTWDAGGGMNFGSYHYLDIGSAGFAGVSAPWCMIVGVQHPDWLTGYHALFGPYSGNYIGIQWNPQGTLSAGLTITSEYKDGVSGISSLANDTPYVLAWRASVGALAADSMLGNGNAYTNWGGRIAFIYIFTGLDDAALADRAAAIAADPYAMYAAAPPTVDSLDVTSGPVAGGTAVSITGTGFDATPTVTFGGESATSVVRVSATNITCVSPAHAAGAVDVVVTNSDAQTGTKTNGYTYLDPAPTVTSLDVVSGSESGGTAVDITGTGFTATPGVTFGGTAATSVVRVSATHVTCVTPAHAPGAVNVVVTNPDTQAATKTNGYTYTADQEPFPEPGSYRKLHQAIG
jgi:hypothetical protein